MIYNIDFSAPTISQGTTNLRIKTVNKQQTVSQPTVKPTEHTSIGGISVGYNTG